MRDAIRSAFAFTAYLFGVAMLTAVTTMAPTPGWLVAR